MYHQYNAQIGATGEETKPPDSCTGLFATFRRRAVLLFAVWDSSAIHYFSNSEWAGKLEIDLGARLKHDGPLRRHESARPVVIPQG